MPGRGTVCAKVLRKRLLSIFQELQVSQVAGIEQPKGMREEVNE